MVIYMESVGNPAVKGKVRQVPYIIPWMIHSYLNNAFNNALTMPNQHEGNCESLTILFYPVLLDCSSGPFTNRNTLF